MNTADFEQVNEMTKQAEYFEAKALWNSAASSYQAAAQAVPKYRGSKKHVAFLERRANSCKESAIFVRCVK